MNSPVLNVCLSIVLAAALAPPAAYSQWSYISATPGSQEFSSRLRTYVEDNHKRGGILMIASHGVIKVADFVGYEDAAQRRPVDQYTRWRCGSMTKTVTATAVMQLVENGKIKLADKAYDLLTSNGVKPFLLPGTLPDERIKRITIQQLLNHTGGWDRDVAWFEGRKEDPINWGDKIAREMKVAAPVSPSNFVSYTMGLPLQHDPGTVFAYSNIGYDWLALIVVKVSGESFGDYVAKHILRPLGISSEEMCLTAVQDSSDAPAHVMQHDEIFRTTFHFESHPGSGGLESTASGWMKLILGFAHVLSPKSLDQMVTPPPLPGTDPNRFYGFGMKVRRFPSVGMDVWHSGDVGKLSESLWLYTHSGSLCVIFVEGGADRKGDFDSLVNPIAGMVDRQWPGDNFNQQFLDRRPSSHP